MKTLDGLRWKPKWVSYLGCLQGCLEYLGAEVSDSRLFGLSGQAFVINIHEQLCPSGPTAWNTFRIRELSQNVGCVIEQVAVPQVAAGFHRNPGTSLASSPPRYRSRSTVFRVGVADTGVLRYPWLRRKRVLLQRSALR